MLRFLGYLTILLILLQNTECKKKIRPFYFLKTKYDWNAKYLNNFVLTINPGNTSINMLLDIGVNLSDIWGKVIIYQWDNNKNKYRQILAYDVDICQYFQRLKTDKTNLLNAWILNFFKYGNITKTCPMTKNLYYFASYKPDRESIPGFAPAGKSRLSVAMYSKKTGLKESIGNCEIIIELK